MNEEQLENLCLDCFRECGWSVLYKPDIAPDGGVKPSLVCNNKTTQSPAGLASC